VRYGIEGHIQALLAQPAHGLQEKFHWYSLRIVVLEKGQLSRQLALDRRCCKVESFQHEGDDIAPSLQCRLDLAP
jgi:hypothetical protein